jgi:L,D-peptidoglycan transpeptidase YkuD (ErfK/YbiS/YcfS/YnhG family)|tara:strand:+ start:1354 stop:1845 length:492 start_codon:yes stop_codon:yes gene_type:complete
MHIKLLNKKLYFKYYKVKCAVGKRGISSKKKEGDNKTPKGSFKIKYVFYRKDRIKKLKTKIKKIIIRKKMGWCDDPKSLLYNKLIKLPYKFGAEKLYLKKKIYDIILVLNYNTRDIVKNAGSAIFIHLATNNYKPTKGCIAISQKDMLLLLENLSIKNKFTIC